MRKSFIAFALIFATFASPAWADNCTTISQYGITWAFSSSRQCGQFLDNSWWVVAPVTIDNQTPAWTGSNNGAMLDPAAGTYTHGYQTASCYSTTYDNSLRVVFPVTISSGVKSLVSVISRGADSANCVDNAAVLTVVDSAPAANSFRPAFVAGTKTIFDNSAIDYTKVPSYTPPGTVLDLSVYLDMPILNYGGKTQGDQAWVPRNNFPGTGSDQYYPPYSIAPLVSRLSMMMMLNTASRRTYINKLIQIGIDDYAKAVGNDFAWQASGGYGVSHLWPIVFAGKMLDNATMLNVARYSTTYPTMRKFSEQGYTYYNNVGTAMFGSDECAAGAMPYPPTSCSNVMCRPQDNTVTPPSGFPENYWTGGCGGDYRNIVSTNYAGEALAIRILDSSLGTVAAYDHPAFLDYTDYWVANPKDAVYGTPSTDYAIDVYAYGGTGNGFMKYMWTTYRGDSVPAAFSFTDVTGAALGTVYTSNAIQVTGIDNTTTISITGGTYSINGGAYTSSSGTVALNDNVAVRVTSSVAYSTAVNAALTVGGVSDTYTVTTMAAVSDPVAPRMRAGTMSGGWR